MGGDIHAVACGCVPESVIFADDVIALHPAHAERDATMEAQVVEARDALGVAIEDEFLIEQRGGKRSGAYFRAEGDRMPESSQHVPVGPRERTIAGELRLHGDSS